MTSDSAGGCSIVTVERQLTAVIKAQVPMTKIPEAERSARARIDAVLPTLGAGTLGDTFTLWRPPADGILDMEPGTIVSRAFAPIGDVVASEIPAGRTRISCSSGRTMVFQAPGARSSTGAARKG